MIFPLPTPSGARPCPIPRDTGLPLRVRNEIGLIFSLLFSVTEGLNSAFPCGLMVSPIKAKGANLFQTHTLR